MNTKDIKLVFLTGTPIINNPFELVPTFNLLKGYITETLTDGKFRRHTLFPENQKDFDNFFIENIKGVKHIKNKDKFQNRIFGLISYYGEYYFDKTNRENFPEEKEMVVRNVHMSLYQFGRYQEARDLERKEESNKFKKFNNGDGFVMQDNNKKGSSSYRIRSRQISNYFIPEYALTFKNSRTSVVKHLDQLKIEDLQNLDKYSPKFKQIIDDIKLHPHQTGYIYSEFVFGEGLHLFAMVLEASENYIFWEKSKKFASRTALIDEYSINLSSAKDSVKRTKSLLVEKTYAFITGDIDTNERQNIINVFNSKENMSGELIALLLISKSGAEGLSLRNARYAMIMEPFWNYARIEQVRARGSRFQSHKDLQKKDQNITTYIYLSTYPKNYNKRLIKERTTDEELIVSSLSGKTLRDDFELAMVESSIDCSFNFKHLDKTQKDKLQCKLCAPTGEHLYNIDLYKDLIQPNTCKDLNIQKTVDAKEIKIQIGDIEEIFYYVKKEDEIKIFKHDDAIDAYIPLKKSYPYYGDIVRKILNF